MKKWIVSLAMLVFIATTAASALALVGVPDDGRGYVAGQVIIGFNPQLTEEQVIAEVARLGGTIIKRASFPKVRARLVSFGTEDVDEAIARVQASPARAAGRVLYAERNSIRRIHGTRGDESGDVSILAQTKDPYLPSQWGYYDAGAATIPASLQDKPGPIVAVIDTGVDYTHPDLAGRVLRGYDYVNNDPDPLDDHGHGTHVSGVIAANPTNGFGIAGIAWRARILAIKALNFAGSGTSFDIALAIKYAANYPGVRVVNMSLGGGYDLTEEQAVNYLVNTKGKLLIASAGNGGTSDPNYPAYFSETWPDKVIAVAAHGTDLCKAGFSQFGTWVDITAPGVDILSTLPTVVDIDGYDPWDGTSMAAPHVAGAAAVLYARYPTATNAVIGSLLTTKVNTVLPPVRDGICWPADGSTFGRLSIFHALMPVPYEDCSQYGNLVGNASDAETGLPLAGASVFTKIGATLTGKDTVPLYGYRRNPLTTATVSIEGVGLFSVLTNPNSVGATTLHNLYISKPAYGTFLRTGVEPEPCSWTQTEVIPVPPNKGYYYLTIGWNQDTASSQIFDLELLMPDRTTYIAWNNGGTLDATPFAQLLWDCFGYVVGGSSSLRRWSETIRIGKVLPGTYTLFVDSETLDFAGWGASGITANIWRYNAVTRRTSLIKSFTPPAGTGKFWNIADIKGNTITPIGVLSPTAP